VAGVLELAGTVAGTLNLYYGFILFTLLLGGAVLLIGTASAPNPVGGVSVAILLVLGLLAWAGALVTNLRPIQADIIFKQGNPFEAQGEWGLAIRHYQRAIDFVPREDSYYLRLGRVHLEYAKTLPEPAERRTALIQTERTVKRARGVHPLNTDHSANLARLYHAWAELAEDADTRQEMIQRSEENYEIATRLSPQNAILWNEWANLYLSTGQFEKAQETIAYSLEMDPRFAQTWTLQGDIHANQDRLEEALTAYETSLEVDPNQIDVWLRVGAIQREQGDLEQAVRAYERVLALRSGEVQAWRALGSLYGEAGDHEKGIEALQQALELAPQDNDAWDTHRRLAILYSQTAQQEAALRHGEQALQMAPADRQRDIEEMLTQLIRSTE